jgi:hypothetical protein
LGACLVQEKDLALILLARRVRVGQSFDGEKSAAASSL